MTTPGGVPNLPPGALTVDNMESQLQDTSVPAVRDRAAARMPGLFNNSNGGNPISDLTPFGILTKIFAGFNSTVANADPNDIQGPEDLPGLLWEFIENLPVVGELVGLGEAILGNYDGDDPVLLAIQDIFQPIRRLLQLFTGQGGGFPTKEELEAGWENLFAAIADNVQQFKDKLTGFANSTETDLDNWVLSLLTGDEIPASSITTRTVNLQRNHNFASASILSADKQGTWSLDPDNRKGLLGNGLKVVGGGFNYVTLPKIRVSVKQGVSVNAYVRWAGVTGPNASVVAYVHPIGGAPHDWQFLENRFISGSEATWIELGGDYTVVDEDVEYVEVILSFTDATAGTVWFSETSVIKPLAPGTIPGVLVDGLADGLDAVGEFAQSIGMVIMKVLTGLPFVGWLFDDLEDALADFFDDTQNTAARADDAWGWVKDTWDNITQGWNNDTETGRGLANIFDVLRQSRRNQDEMAAGIAALQAQQSGAAASGKSFDIKVSDYTVVPSVFTKFYDGGSGATEWSDTDGGTLRMTNNNGLELWAFNGPALLTDYSKVSLLLTRQTVDYVGSYGNRAVWFVSRLNAARTEGLVCRMRGRTARFGYVFGGNWANPTWLGNEQNIDVASAMTFVTGTTQAAPRQMQLLANNIAKATKTDAANAFPVDAAHRGWGWGLENDVNDLINRSAYVGRMLATDNYPPTIPGTYATMNRLLTSNIGVSTGVNPFPASFFNNVAESSPDIAVDLANAAFTITDAGMYTVTIRVKAGSSATTHLEFLVYVNGVPFRYIGGDQMFGSNAVGGTVIANSYFGTARIPLPAGAVVRAGYRATSSTVNVLTSETSGLETYFSIAA